MELSPEALTAGLAQLGYVRKEGLGEEGEFMVKGDTLVVYPATFEYPLRVELSHDRISRFYWRYIL